jgi:L-alanine-DL-glutamate epimerase-like enolase superfamily enzyme
MPKIKLNRRRLFRFIAAVRDNIGKNTPLAADHFGNLTVKDSIRYAKAFEPYNLAWAGPWPHYDDEGKWCNCVTR